VAKGGTKIYCPGCKSFSVCKAISPTSISKPKAQRWYRTDYQDIAWFRRGRVCLDCGLKFLSAEVDEVFIEELVELRERLAEKQKAAIRKIRRNAPWLKRSETIPIEVAKRFIRASAWWLTHSSGSPVRAPGHADRIYKSHHGWAIDFGANTFLVGKAIERCKNVINDYLNNAAKGRIPLKSEVIASLKRQVSGAVANVDGYEYAGYYPIDDQDLVFGAQSINLLDAARFMLRESGIEDLLLDA
jgi:hypothetical protein